MDSASSDTKDESQTSSERRKSKSTNPVRATIAATPTTNSTNSGTTNSGSNIYYLAGHNGANLVELAMQERGWKRCTEKSSTQIRLIWTECLSQVNYSAFREGEQMVNHIPNCGLITNKLGLLLTLREYEKSNSRPGASGASSESGTSYNANKTNMSEFVPETYIVDDMREREAFYAAFKKGDVWIYKPTGANQGKGISLVRDLDEFKQMMVERDEESRRSLRGLKARILQRYIPRPLLIHNRKFDIRCYMIIACTTPFLVLFHPGYLRLSIHSYSLEDTNLTIHLTNQFIQKKDPSYHDVKDDTVWSMEKFNEYINETVMEEKNLPKDWVQTVLDKQMQKIMLHVFSSVKNKLSARMGFFELYGFDFMIDENMKVWLIEVNVNPAMHTNCDLLKKVLPPLIGETIDLAVECFEKARKDKPLMPLQSIKRAVVIHQPAGGGRAPGAARYSPKNSIGYWVAPRYRPHCNSPQRGIMSQNSGGAFDSQQVNSPTNAGQAWSSEQQQNATGTSIQVLPLPPNRNFESSLRRYDRKSSWNYGGPLPAVSSGGESATAVSANQTAPRSSIYRPSTLAGNSGGRGGRVGNSALMPATGQGLPVTSTNVSSNSLPLRETVRLSTVQVVTGSNNPGNEKPYKRSGRKYIDFSA